MRQQLIQCDECGNSEIVFAQCEECNKRTSELWDKLQQQLAETQRALELACEAGVDDCPFDYDGETESCQRPEYCDAEGNCKFDTDQREKDRCWELYFIQQAKSELKGGDTNDKK